MGDFYFKSFILKNANGI
uniref:Uncharacterized protein n=1 Tax=Arundo donax TaxID=35708 RepID=A0A0A8YKE4_ARUDO